MNVQIKNRQGKVSEAVDAKVHAWLQDCQERYTDISSAHVVLDKNDREDMIEASLHVKGHDLFAKASGENLYSAFDAMTEKLERQLAKLKAKQTSKKGCARPALNDEVEMAV